MDLTKIQRLITKEALIELKDLNMLNETGKDFLFNVLMRRITLE